MFLPAQLFAPTPKAAKRVFEFFTTQLNNDRTRKAYLNATRRFANWCEARGIKELAARSSAGFEEVVPRTLRVLGQPHEGRAG